MRNLDITHLSRRDGGFAYGVSHTMNPPLDFPNQQRRLDLKFLHISHTPWDTGRRVLPETQCFGSMSLLLPFTGSQRSLMLQRCEVLFIHVEFLEILPGIEHHHSKRKQPCMSC